MKALFKRSLMVLTTCVVLAAPTAHAQVDDYHSTVATWSSYKNVEQWLKDNFTFDKGRQKIIQKRLRAQGPTGLLVRNPETLFNDAKGYCGDAAYFALDALNRISPEHNARWIFIKNGSGKTNHWVTGFTVKFSGIFLCWQLAFFPHECDCFIDILINIIPAIINLIWP